MQLPSLCLMCEQKAYNIAEDVLKYCHTIGARLSEGTQERFTNVDCSTFIGDDVTDMFGTGTDISIIIGNNAHV